MLTGLDLLEQSFFDPSLLETAYFRASKADYLDRQHTAFLNEYRNYRRLLLQLTALFVHNANHPRSYAKRLRTQAKDRSSCEAIVAEIIVYYHHLALIHEGYVKRLLLEGDECDLIVERSDGRQSFLEVLCIMPSHTPDANGLVAIRTHTQAALGSVRQKLLPKIAAQGQLAKDRENWAVIELNDATIAGQFAVLASLSGGYQIQIDKVTGKAVAEGYDWEDSIFHVEGTQRIRGIIYFDVGNYSDRRFLLNPNYASTSDTPEA